MTKGELKKPRDHLQIEVNQLDFDKKFVEKQLKDYKEELQHEKKFGHKASTMAEAWFNHYQVTRQFSD